ncbi:hypothetical protein K469DRAFT_573485, partial [Zopfia rhizophila CBS 207.26]
FDTLKDELLFAIFQPLNDIHAQVFEFELDIEVPESVRHVLRPIKFTNSLK